MAQTKTRNSRSSSSSGRSKSGSKSGPRSGSTSKTRSRGSASSGSRNKGTARKRQSSNKSTMAKVAEKAKAPALVGGTALVGLAGGVALKNGRKRRGVLDRIPTPNLKKVSLPEIDSALKSVGKAAGEVSKRSHRVGDVANEVEKASKAIGKKT